MKPFTEEPDCEKCGNKAWGIEMFYRSSDGNPYIGAPKDYLVCKCRRCQFTWTMLPRVPLSIPKATQDE